jgi:hypothetical protein
MNLPMAGVARVGTGCRWPELMLAARPKRWPDAAHARALSAVHACRAESYKHTRLWAPPYESGSGSGSGVIPFVFHIADDSRSLAVSQSPARTERCRVWRLSTLRAHENAIQK